MEGAPAGAGGVVMSRDATRAHGPAGTIRIDGGALAALVIAAAELVDGARVRRPRRGLDIAVTDGTASRRAGARRSLRDRAARPRARGPGERRGALRDSAGLDVAAVDVSIEELDG